MPTRRAPQSSREIMGDMIATSRPIVARNIAEVMGTGPRTEQVESERRSFWTRSPDVSQEQELQMLASGMDPYEVSKAVYPYRWDLETKGGRIERVAQIRWAARLAKLGPPEDLVPVQTPLPTMPMPMSPEEPMPAPMDAAPMPELPELPTPPAVGSAY